MTAVTMYTAMTEMALVLGGYVGSFANVSLPNKPYEPPPHSTDIWYKLEIEHDAMGQGSLADINGKKMYDREGAIYITIYTPLGVGTEQATNTAEALINLYNAAVTPSDVWFRNAGLRDVESERNRQPLWYQTQVVVEFSYTQIN